MFWIQAITHDDGMPGRPGRTCMRWAKPAQRAPMRVESMSEGTAGHQLVADLDVQPGDDDRCRRRATAPASRARPISRRRLRAGGYDTVLITGTVTNVCCESTSRATPMMLNFKTIMVADGNATRHR